MHLQLPTLHELEEWSFTPGRLSGPHFRDATFDNTTLWSAHRYHCYSDCHRQKHVFSSQVFESEVACHTSLIKLRHECKELDLWIQVERYHPETGWTILN